MCHHPTVWTNEGLKRYMQKQKTLFLQGTWGVQHPHSKEYCLVNDRVVGALASCRKAEVLTYVRATSHLEKRRLQDLYYKTQRRFHMCHILNYLQKRSLQDDYYKRQMIGSVRMSPRIGPPCKCRPAQLSTCASVYRAFVDTQMSAAQWSHDQSTVHLI